MDLTWCGGGHEHCFSSVLFKGHASEHCVEKALKC